MARPDSRILGLIGCGSQAVTQLHALSHVFDIDQVLLRGIAPSVIKSFEQRVVGLDIKLGLVQTVLMDELASPQSDIISVIASVGAVKVLYPRALQQSRGSTSTRSALISPGRREPLQS
ncbi:MAG: L-lysine cyclodeaminase [Verrucomicrobia subdivision 3 bacterium]|nr:L-lysine cyclodeaminase [Limisphaerales bacterium]MCS1413234.1 L-lysine cyclodeaminase [Limisphaerales bacterium]